MKLGDYLKARGETLASFGQRVGCTHATVSRLANGKLLPSARLVARIEKATGGQVGFADFDFTDPDPEEAAAMIAA